ncbi:hypothetical protein T439DRAFT_343538 [Meredithblackwellia eburnea MCA 4105]
MAPQHLETLKKQGVVVVPSVISKERAAEYESLALDWAEGFNLGFKRDDPETWHHEQLPDLNQGGLCGLYGVSHEDFVWKVRTEPGVLAQFEELWGTKELLVSFDAINVTLPVGDGPRSRKDGQGPTGFWAHIDQEPNNLSYRLTQGFVAITESGPKDGGLIVIKNSHLYHEKFFARPGAYKKELDSGARNFYRYTEEDVEWYLSQPGVEKIKVEANAGDLVMWDSRTIHWNCTPEDGRIRVVVYTCYAPRSHATAEVLKRKAEIFEARQRTTHWPAENTVLAPPPMPRAGNIRPASLNRTRPAVEPVITDQVLRLVGALAY